MTITIDEQSAFELLLKSPRLKLYNQDIARVLDEESTRRQRFYEQMTEGEKTEFINGEVILHSPAKLRHNRVQKGLLKLLDEFVEQHDLGYVGYEKILIALTRNDYEPDICFFRREVADQFTDDQMVFPEPDFVVEVLSDSTEGNDRVTKFQDYAAHGVTEYWIIDPQTESIEQYELRDGAYELLIKAETGDIRSVVLPQFYIPIRAIFDSDLNRRVRLEMLNA